VEFAYIRKGEILMKRAALFLNVLVIVLLISLFVVSVAAAQAGDPTTFLLEPFAPILAASAAVERTLQLIRRIVSPDLEVGPLARNGKGLKFLTTYGCVALGLLLSFWGNIRLLESVDILIDPMLDLTLTGIVVGMGSEFVHEVIGVVGEGKEALRASAKKDDAVG
jgi:hypothetical protein